MFPTLCDVCYDVLTPACEPTTTASAATTTGVNQSSPYPPITPFRLYSGGNKPSNIGVTYPHILSTTTAFRQQPSQLVETSPLPWKYRNYTTFGYHDYCFSPQTAAAAGAGVKSAAGGDRLKRSLESNTNEGFLHERALTSIVGATDTAVVAGGMSRYGNFTLTEPTTGGPTISRSNTNASFVFYRNSLAPNTRPNGAKIMEGDLPYFRYLYDNGVLFSDENDSVNDRSKPIWFDNLKKWIDNDQDEGANRYVSFVNTATLGSRKVTSLTGPRRSMPLDKSKQEEEDLFCRRFLTHFGLWEEHQHKKLKAHREDANSHLGREMRRDQMLKLASEEQKKSPILPPSFPSHSNDSSPPSPPPPPPPEPKSVSFHQQEILPVAKNDSETMGGQYRVTKKAVTTPPIDNESRMRKEPLEKAKVVRERPARKEVEPKASETIYKEPEKETAVSVESESSSSQEDDSSPPDEENKNAELINIAEVKIQPRLPVQKRERVVRKKTLIQFPMDAPVAPQKFFAKKKLSWLEEGSSEPMEEIVPELPPLPPLPPTPSPPRILSPIAVEPPPKPVKSRREKTLPLPKISEKIKKRWGDKKFDRSYSDWLEKQRLAEERMQKMNDWLNQMKKKVSFQPEIVPEDGAPRFGHYGFLSQYCIINRINMPGFRHTFEVVDEENKGWLTYEQIQRGLKVLNPSLTDPERRYITRVMELCEYDVTRGADLQLFSVLAALSERITTVDDWLRTLISKTADFPNLEVKLLMCRHLWTISVNKHSNTIPIDELCVELSAGGVTDEHIEEVFSQLGSMGSFDLVDFLAYVPLFITLHQSIINNPLDRSQSI